MTIVVAVLIATATQSATSLLNTRLLSKAGLNIVADLRQRVQQHVGRLALSFYDSNRVGALTSRIMNDVDGVRSLIGSGLVELLGGILTASMAFSFLMYRSPMMTLIVFAVIALFLIAIHRCFKIVRPILGDRAQLTGQVTGRLSETLGGIRVVKGYHAERREADVFTLGILSLLEKAVQSLNAMGMLAMASTSALGIVGGLVMLLSGLLAIQGKMGPGDYIQYTMFLAFMVSPMMQLVNIATQLTEAVAGIDRTAEILSVPDEFMDSTRINVIESVSGRIVFENVCFSYDTERMALQNVSFCAEPGSVTALVGSSGSGKSTIISLLCGFYKALRGYVLVDDIDLSTIDLKCYRSQLGIVFQDSFLFDGSIRDNVLFSRPGATEEEFLAACRISCVSEFAERLPKIYETTIGERGVKLSGGQRQRLSIARAVLANPRILILDEATSSLDSESEAMIQKGLSYLMKDRTTFVIAHRLSTIRRADQILVVENGQIVERGTHKCLFAGGGRYYELYTRQYGLEMNLFLSPGEGEKTSR